MILPGVSVFCVNRCIWKDQFAANSHFSAIDSGFNDLRQGRAPGIVYSALSSQSDNLKESALWFQGEKWRELEKGVKRDNDGEGWAAANCQLKVVDWHLRAYAVRQKHRVGVKENTQVLRFSSASDLLHDLHMWSHQFSETQVIFKDKSCPCLRWFLQ